MAANTSRRERYSDGFSLTKYTLPVVWQMASVIPGGFFIYREDEKRELIYANQRVCDIYGCEDIDEFKALTGFTFNGMVHPDDFHLTQDVIDTQIDSEEGDSFDHVEYRIIRKDGEVRWVDDYGHFGYSPEYGDLYYVFISDITDQKIKYNKLKESANKLVESLSGAQLSDDAKKAIEEIKGI